jgi:hypothetical protein
MKASLAGWTEILQIYAAYLAQRSSETGAVSGVLVYTITSVAKGGILSPRTILPTPTIRMRPCAILKSSSRMKGTLPQPGNVAASVSRIAVSVGDEA